MSCVCGSGGSPGTFSSPMRCVDRHVLSSRRRLLVRALTFPRSTRLSAFPHVPPLDQRISVLSFNLCIRALVRGAFISLDVCLTSCQWRDSHTGLDLDLRPIKSQAWPRPAWNLTWGELSCSSRRVGCGARPGGSTWRGPRSTPSLWTWNNARKTREVRPHASRTFTHSNAG